MAEEFKGINKETLKNVEALKGSMKDIAEATASANKQLQQQDRLIQDYRSNYTAIVASAGKFAQLQNEASKSASATGKALKEQQTQLSNVRSLNAQIENLMDQMVNASKEQEKLLKRQVNNLSAARDNAKELANAYGELVDSSSKLDKSTMWFSSISEIVKDIPGLRKLSSPFEAAAKAARETTISNAKNQTFLEEALKTGKGLTKEKIKELGLEKEARGLTGNAAAARLKAVGATAKTESASIAGLKAGFAELGPIISQAFGPIAILTTVVSGIKALVNAMFDVDEQVTNIAKNLNVSKDRARDVRQSFYDVKNSAGAYGQIQEGNLILVENLVKTQTELNEALGLSVDLTEEQNRDFLVQLTNANKFLKLEKTETEGLVALFAQTGEEVEDIKNLILGTTKETKLLTGFQVNERKILNDVLTTSNAIKLSIKGGTEALIQSTINANKFGISLKDLSSTTSALLNFEQSISDELGAELLLGRDLNLDRARAAALTNDQVALTEEVGGLIKSFGPDFQRNSIAQEAFAKTLGKSREEIADMYTKYLETEKLRNNQLKLGEDEIKQIKQKANITTSQLNLLREGKLSGVEFYDILKESGIQSERLTELLAGLSVTSLESQSSQEKFNDALASAKETFTRFVEGKTLDKFANLLTQFINVWQSQGLIAAILGTGGAEAKKEREKNLTSGSSGAEAKKAYIIAEQAERGEGSGVNRTRDVGGMATGGIVPAGYPNDTFRARLSSNEAVIPLDQLMAKFDAMTAAITSNRQSEPKIYLGYTELNTATAIGTYGLNQGVTS